MNNVDSICRRRAFAAFGAALLFLVLLTCGTLPAFADEPASQGGDSENGSAILQDNGSVGLSDNGTGAIPPTANDSQEEAAAIGGSQDAGPSGTGAGCDASTDALAAGEADSSASDAGAVACDGGAVSGARSADASVQAEQQGEESRNAGDTASGQASTAGQQAGSALEPASDEAGAKASVSYKAHLQDLGWQGACADGATAGRDGKRLEALQISVSSDISGGVQYCVHIRNIGWQKAVSDGATAGTTGKSLNVQAIRVKLTGNLAAFYDVFYRVCIADAGWMEWASNYAIAGTTGFDRQVEKLQIELVEKGAIAPESSDTIIPVAYVAPANVSVRAHVQNKGWLKAVGNGKVAGTTGKSLRMEALKISVTSKYAAGGTSASAHVQNKGWLKAVGNGKVAGTTGKSLRMEALTFELSGNLDECYDVFYRVHSQDYGWLDWVCAGDVAGTTGKSKRAEAVQVYVTLRGGTAPDGITRESNGTYFYLDAGHGYSNPKPYDVGAVGSGYREASQTKELVNKIAYYAKKNYNLKVFDNTTEGKSGVNYNLRQDDAKKRGCTAFVSIHFNAGGGSGTESYASKRYGASGSKLLQSIMHKYLVKGTGLSDRGQKDYGWSVCCGSVPSTLLEVCFIDNSSDMKKYKAREDYLARQLAAGLYKASKSGF